MIGRLLALALLAASVVGAPARAGGPAPDAVGAEVEAAWKAAEKVAVPGPADIVMLDQAHLKIPADAFFIPAAEADRIMTAMGNSHSAERFGLVVGKAKQANWLVDVAWTKEGYVKDGDAKDWHADEMLQSLKEGTEQENAARLARGIPALDVVGWVEPPAYDAAAHRLVWSLSLQDRGAPAAQPRTINYNTYALGREGYFSLDLITGSDTIGADKNVARGLLAGLTYVPGKRYQDFNGSTDKVAAYGLAALIGVVAVKKLGLLAMAGLFFVKIWKLLLLAFAGLAAGARRFFGRRGEAVAEPEPEPEPAAQAEA